MKSSFSFANSPTQGVSHQVNPRTLTLATLGGLLALSPAIALAGEAGKQVTPVESSSFWEKPIWLTDLSLGVKESYDSNIYLSGAGSEFFPATLPEGDIATKNKSSFVTTLSPKLGVDFAKLLGSDSALKVFALGYVPDFVIFHNAPTESYASHRFTTAVKATADPVSVSLDNAFTYIDGSHDGLIYPGGASSYTNGTVRERRDQWQERAKASIRVDLGRVFIRPTVSLLYYNLDTTLANIPGYTNYIDRYDLNGGADVGYSVTKDLAFTLGYRYGHQEQAALPFDLLQINASNDYQRALFGVEGSPLKWLKVEASVGPEFKSYTGDRPFKSGVAADGRIDSNSTDVYAEATVTVAPTSNDAFVFKYKRWNWVSSTGKNPYLDSLYDASYRHQFTRALQVEVGLRASQSDYNPAALRNDWLYTASAGLKYSVTKNLGLELAYSYDRGSNDQSAGVPFPSTREFERSVVSTGVTWKF